MAGDCLVSSSNLPENWLFRSVYHAKSGLLFKARSSLEAVLDNARDDADVTVISRRDGADADGHVIGLLTKHHGNHALAG